MRVTTSIVVSRPANELFSLSQDYARRLEWDSYLCEAFLLDGALQADIGVRSHCKNRTGAVMVSRYISYAPPTHAAVEMVSGPWLLERFGGTWRFRQESSDLTKVEFIYNFRARPRFLRWLIEPVIAMIYRRSMERRASSFKAWTEATHR